MDLFLLGFFTGLSLILAIGAQNIFVIEQGLKKQHIFLVCLICSLSDLILTKLFNSPTFLFEANTGQGSRGSWWLGQKTEQVCLLTLPIACILAITSWPR